VRELYEANVVPVREIAALVRVTERTLYKYAQKGNWRPRYARRALAQGAGARFVRAEDAGKPVARGLAAADPARAARAAEGAARALALARIEADNRALVLLLQALRDLARSGAAAPRLRAALSAQIAALAGRIEEAG
jgi:hypothetical protein